MDVLIQGSPKFSDYSIFMRAMGVALSEEKKELNIFSLGPAKLNAKAIEFKNVTENSLRSRGVKLSLYTIPQREVAKRKYDQMFYFCTPGERLSKLGNDLSKDGTDVLVFRY